jgi:hypothetical protein
MQNRYFIILVRKGFALADREIFMKHEQKKKEAHYNLDEWSRIREREHCHASVHCSASVRIAFPSRGDWVPLPLADVEVASSSGTG